MSALRLVPLGDICRIIAGQHIEASLYGNEPAGSPYLTGPADFGDRVPIVSKWTKFPKVFASDTDVLLTVKGAGVGKSNLGCNAAIGRQLMALRPDQKLLSQSFLFHFIRRQEQTIGSLAQGATVPGIGKDDVASLRIPLLPLADQRRIADVLDRAEALWAKRREALAELDDLEESVFLDLLGDPVANPKNWDESLVLGDVADIASGVTKGRKVNGTQTRLVPYLAVANVQDRALNLDTVKSIEATEVEIQRYQLCMGDLLLTEGGDPDKLGRGTLWNGELHECIHQNHIFRVRLTSSGIQRIQPLFLSRLVASQRGKKYFLRSAKQTTGIASINMTQLKGFPILLPPLAIQQEFSRRISIIEKLKSSHRTSLAELDSLFSSLQHRAFRGEL